MGNILSFPSPGIRSVNGVEAPGSNITLYSSDGSVVFVVDPVARTIDFSVVSEVAGTPVIENITLANANQEYNVTLPVNTKKFSFRLRNNGILRYSYTSGGPYFTVPVGAVKSESNLGGSFVDIYVKSSTAGNILELEYWV